MRSRPIRETEAEQVGYVRSTGLTEEHATLIGLSPHGNPVAPVLAYLSHGTGPDHPWAQGLELARRHGAGSHCIPEIERLAARLEDAGADSEAHALYDWLSVLTDGQPTALAGMGRCAASDAERDAAAQMAAQAAERVRRQTLQGVDSLLSLGRLKRASDALAEIRTRLGNGNDIARRERRLDTLRRIAERG